LRRAADASGFTLTYWDATSEDGQAFEAWLRPWTVEGLLAANAELDAAVAELRDQRVAMERHIGTLESQLRMAAESRWVKLGNRFGLGPRLR
jgi:hypothetical protein